MPDLTTTTQHFKRIGSVIAVIVILAILSMAIYLRFRSKPEPAPALPAPTITQDPAQKQPQQFDFSKLQLPETAKSLPVFVAERFNLDDTTAQSIAGTFKITSTPKSVRENTLDGRHYSWQEDTIFLEVSETTVRWEDLGTNPNQTSLNEEELKDQASDFLQSINFVDKDLVLLPETKYLKILQTEGNPVVQNFESAQALEFSYTKELSDLPVVANTPSTPYAAVRIRKDGKIIYFGTRYFNGFNEQEMYALKTPKEAVKEIEKGLGKIVYTAVLDENGQAFDLFRTHATDIQTAIITNLRLAYFLPSNIEEPLQPIFIVEGEFQKGTEKGKVIFYLPAIKNLRQPKP